MTITRATDAHAHAGTILRISVGLEDEDDLWTDLKPIVEAIATAPAVKKTV